MSTRKDPYAGLRTIAEKHGWTLHTPTVREGDYRMTKGWREIRWNRHGHGTCTVRGEGFGAIGRSHFTMMMPGLASREEFAEAILSAYTDEKFLRAVHSSLSTARDNWRLRVANIEEQLAAFYATLATEGIVIDFDKKEDSDG